jgi:ribonuclease VapC
VSVVLDASAVLVLLLDEIGADVVGDVLTEGVLSAVNLAEVLSKLTDGGADVSGLADHLRAAGVLIEPMTEADAEQVAALRRIDAGRLLSLGDRCCLALGRRLAAPVLTADRAWSELDGDVEVRQVR